MLLLVCLILLKAAYVFKLKLADKDFQSSKCCHKRVSVSLFIATGKGFQKQLQTLMKICQKMSTSAAFRNPFMWLLGALYHFMIALAAFGKIS
jgi:hypothetical protein